MIRISIFIALFGSYFSNAQTLYIASQPIDTTASISIDGYASAFYQGQGLTNEFMNKLIFGGYIDSQLKDQTARGLTREGNRLALGYNAGIKRYIITDSLFSNPNWCYAINMDHTELSSSTYSRDLFHGLFTGNADRIGQNLEMGPSVFNRIVFQELGFSLVHKSSRIEFGASFIKGQSH